MYWVRSLMKKRGIELPGQIAANLGGAYLPDGRAWWEYFRGKRSPNQTSIARIQKVEPGSSEYFRVGPNGLFAAIRGCREDRDRYVDRLMEEAGGDQNSEYLWAVRFESRHSIFEAHPDKGFAYYLILHLIAIKNMQLRQDYYHCARMLKRIDSEELWDHEWIKKWWAFLEQTVIDTDPYGEYSNRADILMPMFFPNEVPELNEIMARVRRTGRLHEW